jgi:hypothetical protein
MHLPQHARNYATLINTSVGVKEMVHRTFKNMVPHMNCKVIELDLIRRYNTIQSLRHLIDGWIDSRFNTKTNMLSNLTMDPKIRTILSGWYAVESSFKSNIEDENDNGN